MILHFAINRHIILIYIVLDAERARAPIGESGSIELLVTFTKLAKESHTEVAIQCLRALANLCFDQGTKSHNQNWPKG